MSWLEVVRGGVLVTVQDRGRPGYAALGVGTSGAADRRSHDSANRLVGNDPGAATLEVTLGGLQVRAHGQATVAVTGARVPLRVNGIPCGDYSATHLSDGDVLTLGHATAGLRSYLAVRGGVDAPPTLGSRATDTLAELGPPSIRTGDRIPIGTMARQWPAEELIPPPPTVGAATLHVRLGPRDEMFTAGALDTLLGQAWTVTQDSNRVGMRLEGPVPLERADRGELPSEGMVPGALQVPAGGQPVLFLADHPVTGGYPVIAVVVDDDLAAAAQLVPGAALRFARG
ncbi:biotin-dependent carboxyltransferase family protein [Rhodococcus spelaei]|uniref:5-oxoprolinase subunit C family protein n=1 Tax=Rhodococcus spelaei TaxID=2546320 RepID=UPI0015EF2FB7|nr:biotin-dependent carboxyltransferase family protein [Rhodococcus spelaei]